MLKNILLTIISVLLLASGAIYTASALNVGSIPVNNELPETVSESSFDAENPGINFGLCAGFSDIPDQECFLTPEEIQNIIEYEPAEEVPYQQPIIREIEASPAVSSGPSQTVTVVKTVYMDAEGNESDTPPEEEPSESTQEEDLAESEVLGASNERQQRTIDIEEIKDLIHAEVAAAQPEQGVDWGVLSIILLLGTAIYYNYQTRLKQQKTSPSINKIKERIENFSQKVLNRFNKIHRKNK